MKTHIQTHLLAAVIALSLPSYAGVTVVQNVSPGATSWPGSPVINTVADPSTASVGESFNGVGGNTNLSQTFTITTTNYTLQTIDIYAGTGSGTGSGTNIVLNLYDLGTQTAPNPSSYTASIIGANLLGSGAGLSVSYVSQTIGVLEFDFTGVDQVTLTNGHMYAFELTGAINTTPVFWYRGTSDTYSGGAAYRNQGWINGNNARDFAMAVYGVPIQNGQCIVDWTNVYQRIDGFGASSAWRSIWNSNQADMFFSTNNGIVYTNNDQTIISTNNGIGLSLLRTRIAPGGTTVEQAIMTNAQARGARVWSSPWSPAAQFKSNANVNGGGFVATTANYQAYANQLAGYVVSMKQSYSVTNYAISIQNEPDANVTTYESCNWSAQQIHDFVPYLYNALVASNAASTKIMLPESQNWQDYSNLAVTAMSDSTSNMVGIIADHNYDGANGPATLTKNSYGKALWETEVCLLSGSDSSITNGIYYAGRIHLFLTVAQVNAWHYWWLISGSSGNEGLMDTNANPTPRMFVLGQYSRFVRPNFYRIGANNTGSALISAYQYTNSGSFAIVAVNTNTSTAISQTFNLTNFPTVSSVTPWITSATMSLSNQTPVTVSGSSFTYTLPPQSVVTFVGQGNAKIIISSTAYNPGGPSFVLTWNSTAGATYSVLKTNVLGGSAANWPAIVTSYPVGGTAGGSLSYTDTTATISPAFYRVSNP